MPREAGTTATSGNNLSDMFERAYRTVGDSLQMAAKAQEEALKFWSKVAGSGHPERAAADDWIHTAQQQTDEYLRLLETSYRRNADVLKKVIQNQHGGDGSDLESRTRAWLETSIAAVRDTAQDLASTNLRVAQAWTEAFAKGTQQGAQGAPPRAAQKATVGK